MQNTGALLRGLLYDLSRIRTSTDSDCLVAYLRNVAASSVRATGS